MNLSDVTFPVYLLGKSKPHFEDGVWYYLYVKAVYDDSDQEIKLVLDDQNLPQSTLSRRRLVLEQTTKLYKLKTAVFFFSDLVKLSVGPTWWIDSVGKVFQYKKTGRVPLVYKRVKAVIKAETGGWLVEVEGVMERFKIMYAPNPDQKWAALLRVGINYLMWGLSDQKYKDTTKSI